ncbi:histidine N-acetyltransferase-like [Osmerus eperlanus]|uniref:histidine N-acetyltransferase-like n=1 Tax=Osmerus eperlanus TaxID=29151 RepID=UPI002E0D2025
MEGQSGGRAGEEAECIGKSQGLTFWLARPEDYQEVMSISDDIYWGNDYLPYRYHIWMTQPHRLVILARKNRKLVGLESGLVVDGAETVVVEGLRVSPEERGRGMAGILQCFVDDFFKRRYPTLQRARLTRDDDPGPQRSLTWLDKRSVLSLCCEAGQYHDFLFHLRTRLVEEEGRKNPGVEEEEEEEEEGEKSPAPELLFLEGRDLRSVLLLPSLPSRVSLPAGSIIRDWLPVRPIHSNLPLLDRPEHIWLVDQPQSPSFLSLHTRPYPIPLGGGAECLSVDLFGTSVALARQALTQHLERASSDVFRAVLVHVFMHSSLLERLAQFCEGGAARRCEVQWDQVLMEREILDRE